MPAISFSTLRDKIEDGTKKQTIRPYSPYWMKWRKGDRLVGYWKMRTKEREKLFDSSFNENPFFIKWGDFTDELMRIDGFKDLKEANDTWFIPHYGSKEKGIYIMKSFIVIRWK